MRHRPVFTNIFLIWLVLSSSLVLGGDVIGKVIGIADGDTIKIRSQSREVKVRLYGIDCPERRQPYGNTANQAASSLVFGKEVTLQTYGKDKYGCTIADVLLANGTNVNHKLVKDGVFG